MAKLYKGLASQCANAGQDASPTAGPEAVRDSGIHSEEMLQPYPSAPSSAFLSLMETVIDWMNGPNSSPTSLDPHLCHRLAVGGLYFSTPWIDHGFSHMTCFSHQYV